MKEGWKYMSLGEVCTFISGYTPSKDLLISEGGIPYYKVSDMNTQGNEVYLTSTSLYVFNPKKIIPKGSIVFPKNGGAIFTNKKRILSFDSVVDLNTEAITPNKLYISTEYLYKLLLFIDLSKFDNGGGLPSINIKKMQSYEIPIPSLTEQERIVSYLDAQFAKIDAVRANAEKELQDSKALFQAVLDDLSSPKKGWKENCLGELAGEMYRGSGITRAQVTEDGISCVRYGEIYTTYNYHFDSCVSHTEESNISSRKYFEHGDILFAITGESVEDIGKSIAYLGNDRCLAGGDIVVMKHKLNPKFLGYILSSSYVIKQKGLGKTKLKVVHTNVPSLKSIIIHYPSTLAEQRQIAEKLDSLSEKLQSLQSNYEKTVTLCNDLKQSLLKDIFA